MILELDCGNTLIKWRIVTTDCTEPLHVGCAISAEELLLQLTQIEAKGLEWCRIASVRSDDETRGLLASLSGRYDLTVLQATTESFCAGVTNGYADYQRLGLDRWLAVIGGFHLAGGACLVVDAGTAVTADLVSAQGRHLGGYICPGLSLMRSQLLAHTRRIRYDGALTAIESAQALVPGRSTAEAVERGCLLMLRNFVSSQCAQAIELLGPDFRVFLTGGDAALVADACPGAIQVVDLVFRGLALACPIDGGRS